jgi:hypothetical protein
MVVSTTQKAPVLDYQSAFPNNTTKLPGFDLLRLICICAIAWFHVSAPYSSFLQFRLISLMLLSIALATNKSSRPFIESIRKRAYRMLIPFLFWSLVYAIPLLRLVYVKHESFGAVFKWTMLLYGTTISLWYLPFAFVACTIAERASIYFKKIRLWQSLLILSIIGIILLIFCGKLWMIRITQPPFAQYIYSLSAIPIGMAMGLSIKHFNNREINWGMVTIASLFIVVSFLIDITFGESSMPLITRYMWGSTIFAISAMIIKVHPFITRFAPLAMGVYLIHPGIILLGYKIGFHNGSAIFGVFVILSSIAASWLANKTPLRHVMGAM